MRSPLVSLAPSIEDPIYADSNEHALKAPESHREKEETLRISQSKITVGRREGPEVHANEIVERYCDHFPNSAGTEKRDFTLAKAFKFSC